MKFNSLISCALCVELIVALYLEATTACVDPQDLSICPQPENGDGHISLEPEQTLYVKQELRRKSQLIRRQANNIVRKMNSTRYLSNSLIQRYYMRYGVLSLPGVNRVTDLSRNMTFVARYFHIFYVYLSMAQKAEVRFSLKPDQRPTFEIDFKYLLKSIHHVVCYLRRNTQGTEMDTVSQLNVDIFRCLRGKFTKYNANVIAILKQVTDYLEEVIFKE